MLDLNYSPLWPPRRTGFHPELVSGLLGLLLRGSTRETGPPSPQTERRRFRRSRGGSDGPWLGPWLGISESG